MSFYSCRAGVLSRGLACLAIALVVGLASAPTPEAQGFGRNKIQYDGFEWHVLETEHFDVYYYPEAEELAEIGAHTAEEAYRELESRFDFSLTKRVPLVFYATNLHFKQTNITPGFIPDGVGGFFEFLKGRVVIPADGNLGRFRRVIRHELVHVFTFNKVARVFRDHRSPVERFLPLWFTEGLAEYWSGSRDHNHEMILRDAVASNFFVPLHDFDRIAGTFVMYKEGEAFCHFVSETYGEERILDLIDNVWRDEDFGRVMEVVLGESEEAISDRWTDWIREQYVPKLVDADVPSLVAAPVSVRGYHSKPIVWTRRDGEQEVVFMSNRGSYSSIYSQPVDADMKPVGDARIVVRGERSEDFEAFHLFESRLDVSDAGQLAFVTKRGATDVIHLMDLESGDRLAMLGFENVVAIYSPTITADGQFIAFSAIDRGGIANLYLYDVLGESLRQLTNDVYDDRDPDFSPDGRQLVFSSDRSAWGPDGAYNLFTLELATGEIDYVTAGPNVDQSPRWSPDGNRLAFTSARREADGKFSAQDLWIATLPEEEAPLAGVPSAPPAAGPLAADTLVSSAPDPETALRQLTRFTSASFDPFWANEDQLVFTSFEDFRFTIRTLPVDSLADAPESTAPLGTPPIAEPWAYARYELEPGEENRRRPYKRRYQLDYAAGSVSTAATVDYTAGGAVLAFSDLLGDDIFYVSAYSANGINTGRSFLDGLNASVTRVHLGRRANYGYGLFRSAGPRYDRTDPETSSGIPSYEEVHGALGLVSYPLSFFRRIDLQTSLGVGRKEGFFRSSTGSPYDTVRTALLSNTLALVHDNALYSSYGPIEGWRARASVGYATDLLYSNENYATVGLDVRHYLRITPSVTFASWGSLQANIGRRAKYNLIGGAWSLRGFPFFRVRGTKLWFTSHELRFPVVRRTPLFPIIAGVRGAVFADAAHNWTDGYSDAVRDPDYPDLSIGTTKGAVGVGLRASLLGAFVIRYDYGFRFTDGLQWSERDRFGALFFGWDF
ncbi:MAG: basic secretory protein-like protein [Rubricoccaceae bacterium]